MSLTYVLDNSGGCLVESSNENQHPPLVQMDQILINGDLERIQQKAARARELAERQRQRALRQAERALRIAERQQQRASRPTSVPPGTQTGAEDLARLLELLRILGTERRSGETETTPAHQKSQVPTSDPASGLPRNTAGSSEPSESIFGKVTTHTLGRGKVRYIEGITTLEPPSLVKRQHGQLF